VPQGPGRARPPPHRPGPAHPPEYDGQGHNGRIAAERDVGRLEGAQALAMKRRDIGKDTGRSKRAADAVAKRIAAAIERKPAEIVQSKATGYPSA